MKTIAFPFIFLSLLFANQAIARILTVANQTTPQVAQYNSIQAAHDAALSGDTIYVYPSSITYKGASISKKINILGAGFNKVTDYSDCSKISGTDTLKFKSGSENSSICGVIGNFMLSVHTSNVLIKRCVLNRVFVDKNISDLTIINSKISNGDWAVHISENSFVSLFNNIINGGVWSTINIADNGNALIKNNVIIGNNWPVSGYTASLYNNITMAGNGCNFTKDAIIKNSPNLNFNDNRDIWFVSLGSQNYNLKDSSPGKNAGTDGKDLGIYGGDYPFVDDGAPALPTVYYMKVSPTASQKDGLSVEIKAKTN